MRYNIAQKGVYQGEKIIIKNQATKKSNKKLNKKKNQQYIENKATIKKTCSKKNYIINKQKKGEDKNSKMLNKFNLDQLKAQQYHDINIYKLERIKNQLIDSHLKGSQQANLMINDASSTTTDETHSHQSLDQQQINEFMNEESQNSQNTVYQFPISCNQKSSVMSLSQTQKSSSIIFQKSLQIQKSVIYQQNKKHIDLNDETQLNQQYQTKTNSLVKVIASSPKQLGIQKTKKIKTSYEDRFIPSRKHSKLQIALTMAHDENILPSQLGNVQEPVVNTTQNGQQFQVIHAVNQKDLCSQQVSIADLYKTQVLGIKPPETKFSKYEDIFHNRNILAFSSHSTSGTAQFAGNNKRKYNNSSTGENRSTSDMIFFDKAFESYYGEENWPHYNTRTLVDPIVGASSQNFYSRQMLTHFDPLNGISQNRPFTLNPDIKTYFTRTSRKISKTPFKVLDAPTLKDDFYLNLIDWGENNQIAVGLGSCVYLWSAATSRVTKLCDLKANLSGNNQILDDSDNITSVSWGNQGNYLSIGTNSGSVQIWDVEALKKVKEYNQHRQRVGTLAWNKNLLVSGSRDKKILFRDIRSDQPVIYKLQGHKQEICGLKWSYDNQMLASGGNDNNLFVWNMHSTSPIIKLQSHTAAVKALSWSPHQHGLLISGGGSLDRTIRIWNTITREQIKCIDTGSQVCNLQFCKNRNEFVSTHGYSENQITIWNYPDIEKLAVLTGHTQRVLHLAMSPDGDTIATGAGDETLRFWNINDSQSKEQEIQNAINKSQLLPQKNYLR